MIILLAWIREGQKKWPLLTVIGHSPTDQFKGFINIFSWRVTGFHWRPKPFELNCFVRKIAETSVSEPFPSINNTVCTNKHFVKKRMPSGAGGSHYGSNFPPLVPTLNQIPGILPMINWAVGWVLMELADSCTL